MRFVGLRLLVGVFAASLVACSATAQSPAKPIQNVLLIVSDDLRASVLGC